MSNESWTESRGVRDGCILKLISSGAHRPACEIARAVTCRRLVSILTTTSWDHAGWTRDPDSRGDYFFPRPRTCCRVTNSIIIPATRSHSIMRNLMMDFFFLFLPFFSFFFFFFFLRQHHSHGRLIVSSCRVVFYTRSPFSLFPRSLRDLQLTPVSFVLDRIART